MAGTTLDDIKDAVSKKYAPWDIDMGKDGVAKLHPLMRLEKAERSELMSMQGRFNNLRDQLDGEDADGKKKDVDAETAERAEDESIEALREMILIVGKRHAKVQKFLDIVGDDMAILLETFQQYSEATQSGEAPASPAS